MVSKTYGSDWDRIGTIVDSLKIIIAPEIFTAQTNITLSDGQIVLKGSQYFSWPVACQLVAEKKVPDGFRMLRPEEAKVLEDRYGRSGFGLLVLGLNGLISPNDMYAYRISPDLGARYIMQRGESGYYWLDSLKDSLYPYAISVHGTLIKADDCAYEGYGLPLILVKAL